MGRAARVLWQLFGVALLIGAGYAFFFGYGAGRTIATIYNRIVERQ